MIKQRRNRQTGTLITVGRSSELELNDGEGWALICEDHSFIMQTETRALADRHASDPAGWCEQCREFRTPAIEDTTEIVATSLDDLIDHVAIERNQYRGGDNPCLLCGKFVNPDARSTKYVRVHGGGSEIVTAAEADRRNALNGGDGSDLYYLPIGPDCYRKHKQTLEIFAHEIA